MNKVREFETDYLAILNTQHKDVLNALKAGKFEDSLTDVLTKVANDLAARYTKN